MYGQKSTVSGLSRTNFRQERRPNCARKLVRFVDLAYRYALQYARPGIWVVCGMIASGKSTVAEALADALQIKTLRSDVVRKKLFDRQIFESQPAGLRRRNL